MAWIKRSLSCFQFHKHNRCECTKKINSKSMLQVSDKNIQCDFDDELKIIENLVCYNG